MNEPNSLAMQGSTSGAGAHGPRSTYYGHARPPRVHRMGLRSIDLTCPRCQTIAHRPARQDGYFFRAYRVEPLDR